MMTERKELSTEVRSDSQNVVAMILDAARDPTVDAAKVETMANLAIKLQDRERESEFNRDYAAAIMEMPVITKDGRIVITNKDTGSKREQGRFARFEDVDRVVKPIAARHNIAYSFEIGGTNGKVTVRPIVIHANGFTYRGEAMELPAQAVSPGMNVMQAVGAGSQYGKRYCLCAVFSISTEGADTDGKVIDELPFEREQTVLAEAEAASEGGTYREFFTKQSPKDRAWLIRSGNHARLGGQPAIEQPKPAATGSQRRADPPAAEPETRPEPPATEGRKQTPEQQVEAYEAGVRACADRDELSAYQNEPRRLKWMTALRSSHPELHKRIVDVDRERSRQIDDQEAQ